MSADRKYDITLYGASGFTGKQTVEYCRQFAPAGLRWAIAGRSRSKLDAANSAGVDVVIADAQDEEALNRLAAQTRVVATTAGPFSLYGTKLVDACVRNRTHYCDITGETPWIRGLIDRHHTRAAADGTRIIPCCGFDSIPSDYGAWLVSRHIRDALRSDCASVAAYFRMDGGGGFNGGTVASFFHMAETGQMAIARDPFLLDPDPAAHTAEERERNADPAGVRYDESLRAWVTAFLMGSINTRVVRRTQALQGARFDYQEYAQFRTAKSARMVMIGSKIFEFVSGSAVGRGLIKPLLPKPGEGPSEKAMNEGFFQCDFVGTAKSGARVRGTLKGQGDPGNRITVKCLCESAFVLALSESARLGAAPGCGGVLTPVTGLGDALTARLAQAGINFQVVAA
ncbi:MAG: saccharopine dehydrogenase family protein [Steroidobacteraceae bacterium]